MAFFLDVENLIAGASSLGLPLDLKPVLARLSRQGRIATRRCFGDINAACRAIHNEKVAHEVRHMLQRNLFVIEDIPHTTSRKNSADMRLIIEALSLAYTNETIGEFVILSSDRDYVPLALKLRELGRGVTTVAVSRENINRMVIDASDTVLYYDDLVGPHYGRRYTRMDSHSASGMPCWKPASRAWWRLSGRWSKVARSQRWNWWGPCSGASRLTLTWKPLECPPFGPLLSGQSSVA
jgi:uncharacterized LabA/DUF88 family protein